MFQYSEKYALKYLLRKISVLLVKWNRYTNYDAYKGDLIVFCKFISLLVVLPYHI